MGIAVRRVAVSAANPTIMARTGRCSLRFIAAGRERKRIGVDAYDIGRRFAARAGCLLVQAVRITDQSWLGRPT